MKNTTFRKKALLSSVCMLLVALVALGSATFAWFTANPNAAATGLSMKTTASTGLLIRSDTDKVWDHSAILNATETTVSDKTTYSVNAEALNLQPASQNQNNPDQLWTIGAAKADEFTAESGADVKMKTATNKSDYYAENIYFRLSDGSAATTDNVYLTGIAITPVEGAKLQNAVKVAVVKGTEIIGTYCLNTDNHGTLTGETPTAGQFNPAPVHTSAVTPTKVFNGSELKNTENLEKSLRVYLYLDGQHTDCYSENVSSVDATKIISNVELSFVLQPDPQPAG